MSHVSNMRVEGDNVQDRFSVSTSAFAPEVWPMHPGGCSDQDLHKPLHGCGGWKSFLFMGLGVGDSV